MDSALEQEEGSVSESEGIRYIENGRRRKYAKGETLSANM